MSGTTLMAFRDTDGTVKAVSMTQPMPIEGSFSLSASEIELGWVAIGDRNGQNFVTVGVGGALKVDGSAVVQPVSAASLPLPTGASTASGVTQVNTSIGTLNTSTGTKLDTVAANVAALTKPADTQAVSAVSLPLPTGASTAANQTNVQANAGSDATKAFAVQGVTNGKAVPISGAVSVSNLPATQPVSGTVAVSNLPATQPVSGSVSVANFPATQAVTQSGVWTVGLSGAHVTVDNASFAVTGTFFQATQPVSGTFWQTTQPVSIASMPSTPVTGTFFQATQPVSAASLPLPTGASTAAKQPALGTAGTPSADVLSVQGVANGTALKVDASATTQPVSGTVTAALDASANRTLLTLSALLATGTTSEALLSLTANKAGANQVASTSYTVTAGKTLRLTGLHIDVLNTTTVANRVQINVRAVNGTVGTGSPIVGRLMAASQAALATAGGSDDIAFPEGMCIPAGWQVGISQICSVTTAGIVSVVLTGYEY